MMVAPSGRRRSPSRRTLRLSEEIRRAIGTQLECAYPEEACGGLLGRSDAATVEVVAAEPVDNTGRDRRRRYLIGPQDVVALERRAAALDLQLVGYYHSHPDAPARPSEFDRSHAWPWYVYLIVAVSNGRTDDFEAWELSEDRERFLPVAISDA